MPVSAMEAALARLSFQTNYYLQGAVVVKLMDMIESGKQTFTVDEVFSVMVQAAIDYQIEQNKRNQQANREDVVPDYFDTPIDLLNVPDSNAALVTNPFEFDINAKAETEW